MNSSQRRDRPVIIGYLDKILFGVASAYLLLVLGWIARQVSQQNVKVEPKPTVSAADSQFIAYLQQSLTLLEKAESTQKTLVKPTEGNLSTVSVAPPSAEPEKVIERIYVPMYPPNPPTSSSPSARVTPVAPPKANNIPAPPPPPSPSSTPGQNLLPVAPDMTANSQLPAGDNHTLLGVLEAGQDSSAIFTFDGITRRFEIGEAIGSSGSVLMGVQNQKAVIYRNGQTQYIEVGQKF